MDLPQPLQLGDPLLRAKAIPVTDPEDPGLQQLIDAMLESLVQHQGVGLAAPQVAHSLRLIIVASHPNPRYPNAPSMEPTAMLNPEITWMSEQREKDWEGCLSVPGVRAPVPRARKIRLSYLDRFGQAQVSEYEGFIARIVQHEVDHLDGICFVERVEDNREMMSEQEYRKLMVRD